MRITLATALLIATPALADPTARVVHVPPGGAAPDQPLAIEAEVDDAWRENLVVHYRAPGGEWGTASLDLRSGHTHVAVIPASAVRPPALEYYIEGTTRETHTVAHFASSAAPFRVGVFDEPERRLMKQELARLRGRRARVSASVEQVDFGSRRFATVMGPEEIADRYLRFDADFTYRLLRYPVSWLRFGATHLLGETPRIAARGDEGDCADMSADECRFDAGFRVGGWFELRFRLASALDLDTRGMVVATPAGFNVGGRGELRVGPEDGSHLALGGEAIGDVGGSVWCRLGWDTVPHLPMSATVEVTSYPAGHRAWGVRLIYGVSYSLDSGLTVGLRAGYQARDEGIGGVTLGAALSQDFWLFE